MRVNANIVALKKRGATTILSRSSVAQVISDRSASARCPYTSFGKPCETSLRGSAAVTEAIHSSAMSFMPSSRRR